jgi:hypothetical protein
MHLALPTSPAHLAGSSGIMKKSEAQISLKLASASRSTTMV